MADTFDVIIIGAGISGAASACHLARAGHKVVVIDRYGPAAMASGWTLAGVRQSGRHPAELPLAKAAVALWETLDEDLGAPTHYVRKGNIRLARDADEYRQIRQMVADQGRDGLDLTFLPDNAALREVAPAVSPAIPGASFCASDGQADPHASVAAFVGAATRAGAVFRSGEAVGELLVKDGRVLGVRTNKQDYFAPCVILAGGFMGNELLAPHGYSVPIEVRMVTVLRSVPTERVLEQVIGVAAGNWAGRQEVSGRFRVTSGGQPWHGQIDVVSDGRPAVRPPMATLSAVAAEMERLLPGTTVTPIEDVWAGLIDMTPDALPVLDHAPGIQGLVLGMGFSGHGFCLGPITGRILSGLALEEAAEFDLTPFAATRFNSSGHEAREVMTLHG